MSTIIDFLSFFHKRKLARATMKHLETQEVVSGIFVIRTKPSNFYIVSNGDGYIAIDAGGGNKNAIRNELSKLSINPDKVTAVLLTHTDFDHISALSLFKNATIYLSKQEVQMIDGSVSRMFFVKNRLKYDYKTIENSEEIYSGNVKLKSIFTPGHTNGSTTYLLDDKYLFVGDTLSLQNGHVGLFSSFFNMSDDMQRKSINNLAKLQNVEYIFTCHYGFSNDFHVAFRGFQ